MSLSNESPTNHLTIECVLFEFEKEGKIGIEFCNNCIINCWIAMDSYHSIKLIIIVYVKGNLL